MCVSRSTAPVSVLFSEPKIPQSRPQSPPPRGLRVSVLFSEPKIPQFARRVRFAAQQPEFQCSSASRKFLNQAGTRSERCGLCVSVLFSEPKIPQFFHAGGDNHSVTGFSALQRAENSSIRCAARNTRRRRSFQCSSASRKFLNNQPINPTNNSVMEFQCSSASRKFLNVPALVCQTSTSTSFSALQRAENSSIEPGARWAILDGKFQCSSASRKFLNRDFDYDTDNADVVSVLFSEPKIPQCVRFTDRCVLVDLVSVLFSEPKIPQ